MKRSLASTSVRTKWMYDVNAVNVGHNGMCKSISFTNHLATQCQQRPREDINRPTDTLFVATSRPKIYAGEGFADRGVMRHLQNPKGQFTGNIRVYRGPVSYRSRSPRSVQVHRFVGVFPSFPQLVMPVFWFGTPLYKWSHLHTKPSALRVLRCSRIYS